MLVTIENLSETLLRSHGWSWQQIKDTPMWFAWTAWRDAVTRTEEGSVDGHDH